MQELINRLTEKAGISPDQANKAIHTIREFVKEKFPMVAGAVDNIFTEGADKTAIASMGAAAGGSSSVLDKISDVIPGQAGEKVEAFAKQAADKAEDLVDAAKEKIHAAMNSETGQKVEAFAKQAADKAEDLYDDAKEKLSNLFKGDKKHGA